MNHGQTERKFFNTVASKHFSPAELAEAWGVSVDTIRNIFRNEPGVLKIGDRESRFKRGYITLRIPEAVALLILVCVAVGAIK